MLEEIIKKQDLIINLLHGSKKYTTPEARGNEKKSKLFHKK